MDWITIEEVKEAAKDEGTAIDCSIKHWEQMATATLEEIKSAKSGYLASPNSCWCALCELKHFVGKGNMNECTYCIMKEMLGQPCGEKDDCWNKAMNMWAAIGSMSDAIAFRIEANKMLILLHKCKEAYLAKQVKCKKDDERKEPELIKNGQAGYCNRANRTPRIYVADKNGIVHPVDQDSILESTDVNGTYALNGYITFPNLDIFADLKQWAEDCEESDKARCPQTGDWGKAYIDRDGKIEIHVATLSPKIAIAYANTIKQVAYTALRKEQKKND